MRIIVLNDHGSVTGGAAQVAIASLNALADLGFDVTFVSAVPPVAPQVDAGKVGIVNFGMHELLSNPSRLNAAVHGIWDLRCAAGLASLLDGYDPDDTIVHLHTWTKSLSSSVVREVRKRGFKLVCTLHDYFSVCPNGGLYNFRSQQHCHLAPMSLACLRTDCDARSYAQKLWRYGRHVAQRKCAGMPARIEHFISISDYSENLLRPHLPSGATFHRVRNPIDVAHDAPARPAEHDAFCFIGRLSPEKGGRVFAEAARKAGVRAIFIGSGVEEDGIRLANPEAEMKGWLSRPEVVAAMRASRAVVFPSLWPETQGLVVMEAAALGVPSIVSDRCAANDFVTHGENGLCFSSGDAEDLANCLKMLQGDPEEADRLGRSAYEGYWAEPCTLDNHVSELTACYARILGRG